MPLPFLATTEDVLNLRTLYKRNPNFENFTVTVNCKKTNKQKNISQVIDKAMRI